MVTAARQLHLDIAAYEIQHENFAKQFRELKCRIESVLDGGPPFIEYLLAPSRAGKSKLIRALASEFPETKVNGRRRIPVLVAPLPTPITPKQLPGSVLEALRLPVRGRGSTGGELRLLMREQLRLANTHVMVFDETSHLVETGAKIPNREASDWFKFVHDESRQSMIMFGLPRLKKLFTSNGQLRGRASAPRFLLPYDSRIPEQMRTFHTCVATYAGLFRDAGYPLDVPAPLLTQQCYLLTGGLIGMLSKFMQELAYQLMYEAPRPVTFLDCYETARTIDHVGSPRFPAFERPDAQEIPVADVALHQAYVQVMTDNDLNPAALAARNGGAE